MGATFGCAHLILRMAESVCNNEWSGVVLSSALQAKIVGLFQDAGCDRQLVDCIGLTSILQI
jgi:hypothetical protein